MTLRHIGHSILWKENMDQNPFGNTIAQLIAKLDESPGNHVEALSKLAQQYMNTTAVQEFDCVIKELNESLQMMRIILKYLNFDLEATRRERDQLRMMLEDQD